jgi:hypothetical protein
MEPPNATDRYALFQAQINKMPLDDTVNIGKNPKKLFVHGIL